MDHKEATEDHQEVNTAAHKADMAGLEVHRAVTADTVDSKAAFRRLDIRHRVDTVVAGHLSKAGMRRSKVEVGTGRRYRPGTDGLYWRHGWTPVVAETGLIEIVKDDYGLRLLSEYDGSIGDGWVVMADGEMDGSEKKGGQHGCQAYLSAKHCNGIRYSPSNAVIPRPSALMSELRTASAEARMIRSATRAVEQNDPFGGEARFVSLPTLLILIRSQAISRQLPLLTQTHDRSGDKIFCEAYSPEAYSPCSRILYSILSIS